MPTLADIGGHWSMVSQHTHRKWTRQTPSHPAHASNLGKVSTVPYTSSSEPSTSQPTSSPHPRPPPPPPQQPVCNLENRFFEIPKKNAKIASSSIGPVELSNRFSVLQTSNVISKYPSLNILNNYSNLQFCIEE
jgi:hypothetical protein